MTDSNDDDRRGRPPGRSDRPRTGGDRPRSGGDRPRSGGERPPFRKFKAGGERPFRSKDGDGPRKPREGGDRPFRARDGERPRPQGERPFPKASGDRPFRKPDDDRSARSGDQGDRAPWKARPAAARPRRDDTRAARPERASPRRQEPVLVLPEEPTEERIAKVIARAGVASRRDVEAMIEQGRVTLNGEVLTSPAQNVTPADKITVDGEPLPARERTRLWIFHKPRGLVTTARDPEGRPTVFDSLPEDMPRVVAIGRLDINTEGLLLLTNDGGLAKVIAHPDTGWLRRYKVRAHGEITQADLDRLRNGVTVDGMEYGPVEARLDREQGDNVWMTLGLREGKNREVKRILEHLGLQVNRLIRVSFGPFQLGELEEGTVEEVRTKVLKEQLGESLAQQAGVDFESPVREPIAPFGSPKKPQREDRPERRDRSERGQRPERSFGDRPGRGDRDEAPRPVRPSRQEPRRAVWRADEEEGAERRRPRRGADPKEARAAAADRPRERVGTVETEGRKVKVERLVRAPAAEEEAPPRRRRVERAAPAGDDRPRRPARSFGEGAPRGRGAPQRDGQDFRPRPPRDGDRPPRRDNDERPRRGPPRSDDERPRRGPPRSDGPPRRGPPMGERAPRGEAPARQGGPPRGDGPPRGRPARGDRPPGGRPGGGFKGGGPRTGGPKGGGFKGGPKGGGGGPRRGRP